MPDSSPSKQQTESAPYLGGERRQVDPALWGGLLSQHEKRRREAAQTVIELGLAGWYAEQLLSTLPTLPVRGRAQAGDALALLGDPRLSSPLLPVMLPVPAGEVWLGDTRFPNEAPPHTLEIEGFSLAEYPVTHAQYAAFVEATGHRKPRSWRGKRPVPESANQPVTFVSARDAEAYCAWLAEQTGYTYRLPTEPEWELAARGPKDRREYPWGGPFTPEHANAWMRQGALKRVCAVGLFPEGRGPNGHADLSGNVWEWCASLYWPYPYHPADGREDPVSDDARVMRGGSWRSRPSSARCASRQGEPPTDSFATVGFRVARDA
jgi:formylglycine-generating enzyme required for sulfatase activity